MLDPGPEERLFDGSCGTGTFLAMAAAYRFERFLEDAGTTSHTATREQLQAGTGANRTRVGRRARIRLRH